MAMVSVLAGHGAELSHARTTYGGDKLEGHQVGLDDEAGRG